MSVRFLVVRLRTVLLAGALLLIQPGWMTDVAGVAIGAFVYVLQKFVVKK